MKQIIKILLSISNLLIMGMSLMLLWGWFVSPALEVNSISYGTSLGLILTTSLFISTSNSGTLKKDNNVNDYELQKSYSIKVFLISVILTIFGFIVHIFNV